MIYSAKLSHELAYKHKKCEKSASQRDRERDREIKRVCINELRVLAALRMSNAGLDE